MQQPEKSGIDSFQAEVNSALMELQQEADIVDEVLQEASLVPSTISVILLIPIPIKLIEGIIERIVAWVVPSRRPKIQRRQRIRQAATQAHDLVTRKDARQYLCPALQSVSGDVFEIAKIITPILVSLQLAGTISITLNPVLFAMIALFISRMGIASLCAGYQGKESNDKNKRKE